MSPFERRQREPRERATKRMELANSTARRKGSQIFRLSLAARRAAHFCTPSSSRLCSAISQKRSPTGRISQLYALSSSPSPNSLASPTTYITVQPERMYKHVAKQQRLNAKNLEAHLSDEDSSGDEEDVEMKAQASASGSESGSDEDGEEEDEEELLPAEEEEEEEAEALAPPPPGFPTAQAALEDPIVDLALATGEEKLAEEEDAPLLCVVCPSKTLKKGKMLEVHLGSKVGLFAPLNVVEDCTDDYV